MPFNPQGLGLADPEETGGTGGFGGGLQDIGRTLQGRDSEQERQIRTIALNQERRRQITARLELFKIGMGALAAEAPSLSGTQLEQRAAQLEQVIKPLGIITPLSIVRSVRADPKVLSQISKVLSDRRIGDAESKVFLQMMRDDPENLSSHITKLFDRLDADTNKHTGMTRKQHSDIVLKARKQATDQVMRRYQTSIGIFDLRGTDPKIPAGLIKARWKEILLDMGVSMKFDPKENPAEENAKDTEARAKAEAGARPTGHGKKGILALTKEALIRLEIEAERKFAAGDFNVSPNPQENLKAAEKWLGEQGMTPPQIKKALEEDDQGLLDSLGDLIENAVGGIQGLFKQGTPQNIPGGTGGTQGPSRGLFDKFKTPQP